ncbi:MAG: thiolase family protein, partial [Arenimonas sp.]
GIPLAAGATTINKVCGSGMKAVMLGHDLIKAGSAEVVVAGGMESMTNAPHLLNGSRTGIRFGSAEMLDHMAWDGLTNPYDKQPMGGFGELCADKYQFTREEQDAFAAESVRRALAAQANGSFKDEIAAVTVSTRKGDVVFDSDEQPGKCDISKIPALKPAFKKDGTITAASSSSINDGAAALVLMDESQASGKGLKPLARIVAHSTHSQAPEWFTTAPVAAIEKVLKKVGWSVADVDLFEVNEAFATVAMAPMRELGIQHAKLNINGGACALGHPIGASGARLIVTLIHALRKTGGKRGVAALCIGGGEATAIAIELL